MSELVDSEVRRLRALVGLLEERNREITQILDNTMFIKFKWCEPEKNTFRISIDHKSKYSGEKRLVNRYTYNIGCMASICKVIITTDFRSDRPRLIDDVIGSFMVTFMHASITYTQITIRSPWIIKFNDFYAPSREILNFIKYFIAHYPNNVECKKKPNNVYFS